MMLIAISGTPGSGKTTVGKLLAKKLGLDFVSTGLIFRQMADERNMDLESFSKLAETDPAPDKELDSRQVKLAKKGNVVLEGRLSGLLPEIKADFRIWVDAEKRERARRIAHRDKKTIDDALKELGYREESERKRYSSYYKIDLDNKKPYDIIIDSTEKTPEESLGLILTMLKNKEGKNMDMKQVGIGSVCRKTRGRDAGECVIVELKENRALVTGPKSITGVRRRYVNISHLSPTGRALKIKASATDEEVAKAMDRTLPPSRPGKPKQAAPQKEPKKEIKRLKVPKRPAKKTAKKTAKKPAKKSAKTARAKKTTKRKSRKK